MILDVLRVAQRELERELLLLRVRPNVVVDLVVLAPLLESPVVVDVEEVVSHLIVRQDLRLTPRPRPHHRVVVRRQCRVHPVQVVVVALHHLVRQASLQPLLRQRGARLVEVVLVQHDQDALLLPQQVLRHHLDLLVVEAPAVEVLLVVRDVRAVQEDVVRARLRQKRLERQEVLHAVLLRLACLYG